jgi:hypothetical protein
LAACSQLKIEDFPITYPRLEADGVGLGAFRDWAMHSEESEVTPDVLKAELQEMACVPKPALIKLMSNADTLCQMPELKGFCDFKIKQEAFARIRTAIAKNTKETPRRRNRKH